ncbi:MAG TPA: SRPBCC family protein [Gemmatimonadaceae bacterium]|jgi:hypothetical protein|nr:SRPBCC family protein [Gemmatimonadaceae bacterium]
MTSPTSSFGSPITLGPMPTSGRLVVVDERLVRAPIQKIFTLAAQVDHWPKYLSHYRFVHFRERTTDGGGIVEMSANRPFSAANSQFTTVNWPTWWCSDMSVDTEKPAIRFRHIEGITTNMEVEWAFTSTREGTHVRILHVWNGPPWPLIGRFAATKIIGPVFVHGIAWRTLAGLAHEAEHPGSWSGS